uniref:Uncharacterized protein n=1 Tax=Hypnea pannosa TaxID=105607 RepID=A0A4D6X031_9FLOR|nr:hypothetical protein [Hypnea pannosa]
MFTNLIPITFFNEYIIAPKTWLHDFKDYPKSFMILFYLSCFYYFHTIYIIIITIISLIILIYVPLPNTKCILTPNNILICFFFINISFYINNKNKYITYNIHKKQNTNIVVPEFFIRSILIPIAYNLWLKILFLTTKYELIILYTLSIVKNNKNFHYKKIVFISILSSQLILLISQKISFLYITIIMKDIKFILKSNQSNILFTFYTNLLDFSYFQIKRISYIIQIKRINYITFSIINIKNNKNL